MPGQRNPTRERARAEATRPARQLALYSQLRATLPERDAVLAGWTNLLGWLAANGIRRPNGTPLNRRIVTNWRNKHGFPLVQGTWSPKGRTPCLSSIFAATAWLMTQQDSNTLFRFYDDQSAQTVIARRLAA
jgi:hypothetical protein